MFYVNLFLLFSISGYMLETVTFILLNRPYNSSVLYGTWTSIYGIAVLLMVVVYIVIKKLKLNNKTEKIIYFIVVTIMLTILEGVAGYIIEITQNKIYWNYDKLMFNVGHYMSLEISLIWGVLAILSMYYVIPKIKEFINNIPKIITYIFLGLYIIDIFISFIL